MSCLPLPSEWLIHPIREFTLADALNDPLIRMVMKADDVDPRALEAELRQVAASLSRHATSGRECTSAVTLSL